MPHFAIIQPALNRGLLVAAIVLFALCLCCGLFWFCYYYYAGARRDQQPTAQPVEAHPVRDSYYAEQR